MFAFAQTYNEHGTIHTRWILLQRRGNVTVVRVYYWAPHVSDIVDFRNIDSQLDRTMDYDATLCLDLVGTKE